MNKQLFKKKVREQWNLAMNERIDARNVLDLRVYINDCLDGIYTDAQLDELHERLEKCNGRWFIDIYENIHGENNAVFTDHAIFASEIPDWSSSDDLKSRLQAMSTEEFVEWMNSEFLNRGDHGNYCKIYELYNDNYWSDYVRPMGADIAVGVAKGFKYGRFDYNEQYVLYIDFDDNFITFDTKEQFFCEMWPLDDIVAEMSYRN